MNHAAIIFISLHLIVVAVNAALTIWEEASSPGRLSFVTWTVRSFIVVFNCISLIALARIARALQRGTIGPLAPLKLSAPPDGGPSGAITVTRLPVLGFWQCIVFALFTSLASTFADPDFYDAMPGWGSMGSEAKLFIGLAISLPLAGYYYSLMCRVAFTRRPIEECIQWR